jgi:hypothetical protein
MEKECLQCKSAFTAASIQRKFCGKACSNKFNGLLKMEFNLNKKTCIACNIEKTFYDFSLYNKHDKHSERRDVCKNCSRAKKSREVRSRTWEHDAKKIMIMNSKARAKKSGIGFSISEEDIIIPENCPVLGIPLHRCQKDNWNNSPSIDRIDNSKGYTKDNIVIVSRRANILKKDATIEELQKLASFYQKFKNK